MQLYSKLQILLLSKTKPNTDLFTRVSKYSDWQQLYGKKDQFQLRYKSCLHSLTSKILVNTSMANFPEINQNILQFEAQQWRWEILFFWLTARHFIKCISMSVYVLYIHIYFKIYIHMNICIYSTNIVLLAEPTVTWEILYGCKQIWKDHDHFSYKLILLQSFCFLYQPWSSTS